MSLPNSTDKPYRLIATIEPIQSESLFSFISSDTSRVTVREVSRTNLSPGNTTQVILEVTGVSATPISSGSDGEELIKAKFESDEVEEAKVVVLVPYEVQEPNDNINHIADPVSKRAADGNSIPPVIGVPNGLVVLEYIWNNVITIQVLDQFGDNLSSIYTGSEVKEIFGGTPYKMNQKVNSNGTYSDPVIVYKEHSVVQKLVNNAPNPQILSFLTSPVPTNITFPTVNTTQNIGVEIDGILLNKGVVNRKVKTIQPNIINVDW